MPQSTLRPPHIVEDVFASTISVDEISFEEAFSDRVQAKAVLTEAAAVTEILTDDPKTADKGSGERTAASNQYRETQTHYETQNYPEPEKLHTAQANWQFSDDAAAEHILDLQAHDFQMWGQVSYKFAEILATWRRDELWRQVAPSWEAFVLQHVKLSQNFVNELCELADRAEAKDADRVAELEPFIPCSVQQVAQRIRQYLHTRPDFSGLEASQRHQFDASEYVEFELDNFRVYVWFEYVMPLDGQLHHFSRPWISNIDFQLCGEGFGEGLYSWLNISHTDIQLRKNASASTLTAWTSWAEALQQELTRSFVPAGMAIAI